MKKVEELEGQELDSAVAREVFDLTGKELEVVDELTGRTRQNTPPFSTDIAVAWGVIDEVRPRRDRKGRIIETGFDVAISADAEGTWHCRTSKWDKSLDIGVTAETAPLAICRAALKAVRKDD